MTSLELAELMGKDHDEVLRDIEEYLNHQEDYKTKDFSKYNLQAPFMTSLEIAELTEKPHKEVVRDIENLMLELSPKSAVGIKTASYQDESGNKCPMYVLNNTLWLTLVSGYDKDLSRWIFQDMTNRVRAAYDHDTAESILEDLFDKTLEELKAPKSQTSH